MFTQLPARGRHRAIFNRHPPSALDWFTAEEIAEANGFSLAKRREEWLHARMAAKHLAIARGLAGHPREVRVDRPRFSLSHSHPYAAASLGGGIDVEVMREISERAAHLFLSDEEAEQMRSCTIAHRLLHFWAAKEAAWKARGGEVATLKQIPLRLLDASASRLFFDRAETIAIEDAVIALTS
jgi:phosphopantetheinyl transferase